jgi:hypothetical protein
MEKTPITVAFSTRKKNEKYVEHIKKTCGSSDIDLIVFENNGEKSLTKFYNEVLVNAKNDIIVFCHDDLIFETSHWGKKIIKHFKRNLEYGVIGIAGTNNLINGTWWSLKKSMHGIVNHANAIKKWTSEYSKPQGNKVKQMVVLDGLFLAVHRGRIKSDFDVTFTGFHFYDIPFCLRNHILGVKIGVVTDITLTHLSIGEVNQEWYKNKDLFEVKYKELLPIKI